MSAASLQAPLPVVKTHTIKRFLDATLKLPPLALHGITHPQDGHWCMLPEEFSLILAHEPKAVTQVILEIFFQTVGRPGDGPYGRVLWARLSTRHFVRKGLMSLSQAEEGLKQAGAKGYIFRRRHGKQGWEYAIHFKNIAY